MNFQKHTTLKIVTVLFGFGIVSTAQADIYDCLVGSPYRSVMISTTTKTMVIDYDNEGDMQKEVLRDVKIETSGAMVTVTGGSHRIVINRERAGTDGSTDYIFPHDVRIDNEWGGCTSEKSGPMGYERLRSLVYKKGLVRTNRWPFVFGNYSGYQTIKNVTLNPIQTWNSISGSDHGTKQCTLPKGKSLVPATAKKNEEFVLVTGSDERLASHEDHATNAAVAVGDTLDFLYAIEDDTCAFEHKGKVVELSCLDANATPAESTENQSDVGIDQDLAAEPMIGTWVFTQCKEGQWVWIHDSVLADESNFKIVQGN